MNFPNLKTKRLILRAFKLSDAQTVAHKAGDREIADTTLRIPHPYSVEQAQADQTDDGRGILKGGVAMEPDPKVAKAGPFVVDEKAGKYAWCSCGQSQNQPYCDGTHKAAGLFRPLKFELAEPAKKALCQCKHTADQPYCDGRHRDL